MHSLLPLRQALSMQYRASRVGITLSCLVWLAGCATATYEPAEVLTRDVLTKPQDVDVPENTTSSETESPQLENQAVDTENAARAQYYQQQASQQGDQNAKVESTLSSAEYYVQANQPQYAAELVNSMGELITDQQHYDRSLIVLAYADYAEGYYQQALTRLDSLIGEILVSEASTNDLSINDSGLASGLQDVLEQPLDQNQITESELVKTEDVQDGPTELLGERTYIDASKTLVPTKPLSAQQVDALLLSSFSYQKMGNYEMAVAALIRRESALNGSAKAETTRYIWQVIDTIPISQKETISTQSTNAQVRNRVQQSLSGKIGISTQAPSQFNQWREEEPEPNSALLGSDWNVDSPRSIYVLLPLSSRYRKAAEAVKAGIDREHALNNSSYRPNVSYYDIGDNPLQIGQYYAAALRSGADFIIGPIGKIYSNEVNLNSGYSRNSGRATQVPMLMLGGDQPLNNGNLRLSLSPEIEGQRVAERAWLDGHLSAGVLMANSQQSQRAVRGFTQKWLALGGKLNSTTEYSTQKFDHSVELKHLFGIHKSEQRHRQLSQTLGFQPKFSPYQRGDIDFVFMASDSKSGRIVRPQINFFTNSQLPVYSTSSIYNGIEDKINNIDLDQTLFPVMPWVVRSANVSPYAGQLNMLHAAGMDAYRVASSYSVLRDNPDIAISGNTGQLQIANSGEVLYRAAWARFVEGELQVIDGKGLNLTPIEIELESDVPFGEDFNENSLQNSNSKGSYNDQTWDPRESRRKVGN